MEVKKSVPGEKTESSGRLYIFGAALLWSTAGVCVKFIPWSSFSIASFRSLIGALAFLLYMRKPGIHFNRYNVAGAVSMFLMGILYMSSVKLTTAANAIVLQYIAPILVLLYTAIAENKKPSKFEVLITVLVFGGCILAFAEKIEQGHLLGNVLGVLSGFALAGFIIINRMSGTNAIESQLLGNLFSFVFFLPFFFLDPAMTYQINVIAVALFLGLFEYALAHILFGIGVKKTSQVTTSLILSIEPICNPFWVYLILGEEPGLLAVLGFITVIASVLAYNIFQSKPGLRVNNTQL